GLCPSDVAGSSQTQTLSKVGGRSFSCANGPGAQLTPLREGNPWSNVCVIRWTRMVAAASLAVAMGLCACGTFHRRVAVLLVGRRSAALGAPAVFRSSNADRIGLQRCNVAYGRTIRIGWIWD